MKVVLPLFLLLLPIRVMAEWAYVPLEELVKESDVIVIAKLSSVEKWSEPREYIRNGETLSYTMDYGQGTLVISKWLYGFPNKKNELLLKWEGVSYIICPRIEWHETQEDGIWLLKMESDGTVRANYPDRHVSLSELDNLKPLILAKMKKNFEKSSPVGIHQEAPGMP